MMRAVMRSWSLLAWASAMAAFRPWFFHRLIAHCHFRAVARSELPPASFNIEVTSSVSRILKFFFKPNASPFCRNMRTPKAWKVQITTFCASRPTNCLARSRISAAALLVKVMAAMRSGSSPS